MQKFKIMKNLRIALLLLATLVLCFSSCQNDLVPVPENDAFQYSNDDELLKKGKISRTVPFKGKYTTYPVIKPREPEEPIADFITVIVTSDGTATHLGRSTWSSAFTVDNEGKCNGEFTFERKGTGDQLIGTLTGGSVPTPPHGWGTYEIDKNKSTGKFKGVIGSGTYSYVVGPNGVGEAIFTGTLTFPKK